MYELEIMVGGYTAIVATASIFGSRCVFKSQFKRIEKEILETKEQVLGIQEQLDKINNRENNP